MLLFECSLPLLPSQPTTSSLLFFFTTPTLILPPSACPFSSALLFSCSPHPLFAQHWLVPTLSFPPSYSRLWIWRMQRAEAGLALKKGVPETADFFLFFFPPTWSFRRGSHMCVSSSCRDQAPVSWAEALLGVVEHFKNTYNSLTGISLPLVTKVRVANHTI